MILVVHSKNLANLEIAITSNGDICNKTKYVVSRKGEKR
jgi:hypothetical protein